MIFDKPEKSLKNRHKLNFGKGEVPYCLSQWNHRNSIISLSTILDSSMRDYRTCYDWQFAHNQHFLLIFVFAYRKPRSICSPAFGSVFWSQFLRRHFPSRRHQFAPCISASKRRTSSRPSIAVDSASTTADTCGISEMKKVKKTLLTVKNLLQSKAGRL